MLAALLINRKLCGQRRKIFTLLQAVHYLLCFFVGVYLNHGELHFLLGSEPLGILR
ncbi:hypothetical protein D3C81_2065350 [compost metagenome]